VFEVVLDHIRQGSHLAFLKVLEIRIEVILHINR
jgi:aspartate carbamoyltransferase regulatory subunit